MSAGIYITECIFMCIAFFIMTFGLLLWNPVSFISDYPPEIQEEYYRSQNKEAVKEKLTIVMKIKKIAALIVFALVFAWMTHLAGAETYLQALLAVLGYILVLFSFDTFFMDWILFTRIKKIRLPGTEHMDQEYAQKMFHVKVCIPMIPIFGIGAFLIAGLTMLIW